VLVPELRETRRGHLHASDVDRDKRRGGRRGVVLAQGLLEAPQRVSQLEDSEGLADL
jgi:hypothetical protein